LVRQESTASVRAQARGQSPLAAAGRRRGPRHIGSAFFQRWKKIEDPGCDGTRTILAHVQADAQIQAHPRAGRDVEIEGNQLSVKIAVFQAEAQKITLFKR
jgi:hypothetical protein